MTGVELAAASLAVLVASALQTATGAGLGLVAGPILVLAIGSGAAIQVAIVLNLVLSVALVPGELPQVEPRALWCLSAGTAVGLPLGVALLHAVDPPTLKLVAALAIVGAALQIALGAPRDVHARPSRTIGAGVVSGVMCAGLAMPGPAALWALMRADLAAVGIRATLRALFVLSYAAALGLHALAGVAWREVLGSTASMLPALAAGAVAGHLLKRRLGERTLRAALLALIALTGVALLAGTVLELRSTS